VASDLPKASSIALAFTGVRLPYCPGSYTFQIVVSNGAFTVERGELVIENTGFLAESLLLSPLSPTSQVSSGVNTITIQFVHSTIIPRNSYFKITLPQKADLTGSSCTFTGLEATAVCVIAGGTKNVMRVNNLAVLNERNSNVPISIRLDQFTNPKGRGVYGAKIELFTASDCLFASGTEILEITQIPAIQEVNIAIPSAFWNIFLRYTFEVTPKTSIWDAGDYLLVEFPQTHSISETPGCAFISLANLNSISCTRLSSSVLKVALGVKPTGYASDRKLAFSIDFIRNSNSAGLQSGYIVKLVDSTSNNEFEVHSTTSKQFAGLSQIEYSDAEFETQPVGEPKGTLRLTFKSEHYLERDTLFELRYSDKFAPPQEVALKSSSPSMTLLSLDPALRKVTLRLDSAQPPGKLYLCSLTSPNPKTMELATFDLELSVLTPSQLQVTSFYPSKSVKLFTCTANCRTCENLHSKCLSCLDKHVLKGFACEPEPPAVVVVPSKSLQFDPSFAFLGLAGLLTAWTLITGLFCRSRNYWGNFLFALLQFNFTGFCGWYGYKLHTNAGLEDLYRYLLYGAAAFHLLLSALYLCNITALLKAARYSQRFYASSPGDASLLDQPKRPLHTKEAIEAEHIGLKKILTVLSLLFSPTVLRWMYSEQGVQKGYLWYFEREAFFKIRSKLEVFQLLDLMFATLPCVAVNGYLVAPLPFLTWDIHVSTMLALCALHILVYPVAFGELCSAREKLEVFHSYETDLLSKQKIVSGTASNIIHFEQKSGLLDQSIDEQALLRKKTPKIVAKSILDIEAKNNLRHQGSQTILNKNTNLFQKARDQSQDGLFNSALQDKRTVDKEQQVEDTEGLEREVNNLNIELPSGGDVTPLPIRIEDSEDLRKAEQQMPKKKEAKKRRSIEVARQGDGVYRPVMARKPAENRIDYQVGWADREPEDGELENPRPIVWKDEHGNKYYKYESVKLNLDSSGLKKPAVNKFKENQLFSKWWYNNSSKKYLEIIYEEDEEAQRFFEPNPSELLESEDQQPPPLKVGEQAIGKQGGKAETPALKSGGPLDRNYIQAIDNLSEKLSTVDLNNHLRRPQLTDTLEEYPSKSPWSSKKRFSTPNADIPDYERLNIGETRPEVDLIIPQKHLSTEPKGPLLNGQKLSDLNQGVLKDRNDKALIVENQPLLSEGVLKFGDNTIALNSQDEGTFSLGLIKDNQGKVYRLKDQDLDLLPQGVFLDPEGRVDNINGQLSADLDNCTVVDRSGRKLDLSNQPKDCWENNTFFLNDSETVTFKEVQDKTKLMKGLLIGPRGKELRIKDQYLDDIIRYQIYRDRNLKVLEGDDQISAVREPISGRTAPNKLAELGIPQPEHTRGEESHPPSAPVLPVIREGENENRENTMPKIKEASSINLEIIPPISRTPPKGTGKLDPSSQHQQSNYNGMRQFVQLDSLELLGETQQKRRDDQISEFDGPDSIKDRSNPSLRKEGKRVREKAPEVEDSEHNEEDDEESLDQIRDSILNSVTNPEKFRKPKDINWAKTSSLDEIFEKKIPEHSLENSPSFNQLGPIEESVNKKVDCSPRVYKESPIASARKQEHLNNSFEFEEQEGDQQAFENSKPENQQLNYYHGPVRKDEIAEEAFGITEDPYLGRLSDKGYKQVDLDESKMKMNLNSEAGTKRISTDERNVGFEIPEAQGRMTPNQKSKSTLRKTPQQSAKDLNQAQPMEGSRSLLNPLTEGGFSKHAEANPINEDDDWNENDAFMADLNEGYRAADSPNQQSKPLLIGPRTQQQGRSTAGGSLLTTNSHRGNNQSSSLLPDPRLRETSNEAIHQFEERKQVPVTNRDQELGAILDYRPSPAEQRPFLKEDARSPDNFEWEDELPDRNPIPGQQPNIDASRNPFFVPEKGSDGFVAPKGKKTAPVEQTRISEKANKPSPDKSISKELAPKMNSVRKPISSNPGVDMRNPNVRPPDKPPSSKFDESLKAQRGLIGPNALSDKKPKIPPHSSQDSASIPVSRPLPTVTKPKKASTGQPVDYSKDLDEFFPDEDEFALPSPQRPSVKNMGRADSPEPRGTRQTSDAPASKYRPDSSTSTRNMQPQANHGRNVSRQGHSEQVATPEYSTKPTEGRRMTERKPFEEPIKEQDKVGRASANNPKAGLRKVTDNDENWPNPFEEDELSYYTPKGPTNNASIRDKPQTQYSSSHRKVLHSHPVDAPDTLPDKIESPLKSEYQPNSRPDGPLYTRLSKKPGLVKKAEQLSKVDSPTQTNPDLSRESKLFGSEPNKKLKLEPVESLRKKERESPVYERSQQQPSKDGESIRAPINKPQSVSDENKTMYLEMLADQSFDIEFNIEEVDDNSKDEIPQPEIEIDGMKGLTEGMKYHPQSRLAKIADNHIV
jgi:hypothetical protein